jgi:uncharacterized membrane protein YraQ (UPF0718 family)
MMAGMALNLEEARQRIGSMQILVLGIVGLAVFGDALRGFVVRTPDLAMALLAVVLSLCSEADASVAASMTMLLLLPRHVFLVVGRAVDLKLFAMQAGLFGRAFATRFAPTTFVVTTSVGLLMLGAP